MQSRLPMLLLAGLSLSGCGASVPAIDPLSDKWDTATYVNNVATNVKCQLANAVIRNEQGAGPPWLKNWAAEVTLTLNISEKSAIAAGATTSTLFPSAVHTFGNGTSVTTPQGFVFGFGGTYTQTAGRIIALTWYDNFSEFRGPEADCGAGAGIQGDLKLDEVVFAAAYTGTIPDNMSKQNDPKGPYQNVQQTVTFDVDAGASATPTWRYVNVAIDPTGTFLSVDRDRRNQLLITMGPPPATAKKPGKAATSGIGAQDVSTIHNLSRIVSPLQ